MTFGCGLGLRLLPLAVDTFLCGFVGRDRLIPAPLLCLNIAFKWRVRIVIRTERALRIREPILQIPNDGRDYAQFAPRMRLGIHRSTHQDFDRGRRPDSTSAQD